MPHLQYNERNLMGSLDVINGLLTKIVIEYMLDELKDYFVRSEILLFIEVYKVESIQLLKILEALRKVID